MANQINKITLFCSIILLSCSSRFGYKNPDQVSLNISESINNKTFIAEYQAQHIVLDDSAFQFPISSIWIERKWNLTLDSDGDETIAIGSKPGNRMVFSLFVNNKLNEDNYLTKWIISDDSETMGGLISNKIFIDMNESVPDSIKLGIYWLSEENVYNYGKVLLASFTAIKCSPHYPPLVRACRKV